MTESPGPSSGSPAGVPDTAPSLPRPPAYYSQHICSAVPLQVSFTAPDSQISRLQSDADTRGGGGGRACAELWHLTCRRSFVFELIRGPEAQRAKRPGTGVAVLSQRQLLLLFQQEHLPAQQAWYSGVHINALPTALLVHLK